MKEADKAWIHFEEEEIWKQAVRYEDAVYDYMKQHLRFMQSYLSLSKESLRREAKRLPGTVPKRKSTTS